MRLSSLLLVSLACGLAQAQSKDEAIKKDKDQLQGTWSIVGITDDGKDVRADKLQGAKLTFKGDTIAAQGVRLGKGNECAFRLDPTLKLKGIDFIDQDKSVRHLIYHLDGDKLRIVRNNRATARPTTFDSKPGMGITLINLRRDKPAP